ncbi:MAG: LSU ribosomal protein L31p @ LSU ribosomal protein L31p, zinc-dependent, partial [uncultured Solirubrobacterales bacterium]
EDRHSSRVRRVARAMHLRQRLHHALDQARAERGDLLELSPVLHGSAEAGRHRRARRALPPPCSAPRAL